MNKTVLITGATGGIGSAIALAFAKAGYKVSIHYNSNHEKAEALKKSIEALGVQAVCVSGDISDFDEAKTIVDKTHEALGKIDCLINNSGITKDTLMLRMKPEDFNDVIDVNLKGTWNMIKHVTRTMFKQKSGRIINISSVVGEIGNPGQTNYVASKAAINGMTKSLAKEYGKKHITVNAIAPGFIETKMTESLDDSVKAAYLSQIPLNRFGSVEDVSTLALFLASDDASYITGQIINVNGGMI